MDLGLCRPGGSHQTVASTKSRTAVLAVLSAVALVALGASLAREQSAGAGTRVTVYNPVAPSGALTATLRATEHLQGRCSGGGAAGRPGGRRTAVSRRRRGSWTPALPLGDEGRSTARPAWPSQTSSRSTCRTQRQALGSRPPSVRGQSSWWTARSALRSSRPSAHPARSHASRPLQDRWRTAERRSGMPRTGPRRARQEARERPPSEAAGC